MTNSSKTTLSLHDAHINKLSKHPNVERVFKDESIHRDEYDFHTIAVLKDKTQCIIGYSDHPHHEIFELNQCPVKKGQSSFQSVSDALAS